MPYQTDFLLRAYRSMKTIREFEERCVKEFEGGNVPGFTHVSNGQEAIAVAACIDLSDKDIIGSTHRGHGHCIAKGVHVDGMMAEIYGKRSGTCHGKGGSMHIADLDVGMMGANGIVGGGPPLVCGAGLTAKMKGNGGVALAFFGDGASNQGTTFESLNLATVWKLPVVFVAENNGYAEATAASWSVSCEDISTRAQGFGMPGVTVDGHDFFAVHKATKEAVERARNGGGPTLIECKLDRFFGHFEGDNQNYRAKDEVKDVRENKDCIKRFSKTLLSDTAITADDLASIDKEVQAIIDNATAKAIADQEPGAADLLTDVYIKY
jgi:acetoin:2,6-dichlorophenolindophenol oxidoreductase subunit alpha